MASLSISYLITGSHCTDCSFCNTGVMWSYLLVPVIILAAKFCTNWSFAMFFCLLFDQTGEQENILLNTSKSMIVISVDTSNRCFTRLIWHKPPVHFDTTSFTCSLKVRCASKIMPKFFAEGDSCFSIYQNIWLKMHFISKKQFNVNLFSIFSTRASCQFDFRRKIN